MARTAGLRAYRVDRLSDLHSQLGVIPGEEGPTFVSLQVDKGPPEPFAPIPYVEIARRFEKALKWM